MCSYSVIQREMYLSGKEGETWDERNKRMKLSKCLTSLYALIIAGCWFAYLVLQSHKLFVDFFNLQVGITIGAYVVGGR